MSFVRSNKKDAIMHIPENDITKYEPEAQNENIEQVTEEETLADTITTDEETDETVEEDEEEKDKPAEEITPIVALSGNRWIIYVLILAVVVVVLAASVVFLNTSGSKPMTDVEISAKDSISCIEEAAESHDLGVVSDNALALKKLNQERAALENDARTAYAVNAALKGEWKETPVESKVIYLTFDDGPSPQTPRVLEILDRYNVKATFFVTCQYPESFNLIKQAYDKGHTIGLHSASHDYAAIYANEGAYFADLDRIGNTVKDQIGYVPAFVRFPGGASNTISANYSKGIMGRLAEMLLAKGYQYYDWNASTGDGGTVTKDQAYDNAIKGDGEDYIVMLCHDTPAKNTTVEALPGIIEYYQSHGYTFKAIDRNTPITHQAIAN